MTWAPGVKFTLPTASAMSWNLPTTNGGQYFRSSNSFQEPYTKSVGCPTGREDNPKRLQTLPRDFLPWNKEQRDALHNATAMVGRVMLVQGASGTGRTAVEVGPAKQYLRAGLHVLMTAPSHSAAEEIVEKHMKFGPVDVGPIRVYPRAQEKLHLLSSDGSSTKLADIEEDSSEMAEFDTTLLAVIDEIKSSHRKRAFGPRKFSLEEQVREVARKGSRKLVRAYGVADDEEPGPEVDMWEEVRGFLDKIATSPLGQWEDIDRRNFSKA